MKLKKSVLSRLTARVVLAGLPVALILPGCLNSQRAKGPGASGTPAASETTIREPSAKPGINDPYEDPDVDQWIKRFESESREIAKHRDCIVASVGLRPGMVIADIGAGTGLFALPFAERVGSEGKVLAVDIVPEFLELIRERAVVANRRNVQTVLCEENSVSLPPASIDLAFICDTYHHFEYPRSTMGSVHRALRPGGELLVIDFERIPGQSREWILNHIRAGRDITMQEILAAGFALDDEQPDAAFLEENYFLRFRKKD